MATSDKKLVRSKSGLRMLPVKEDVYNPLTLIEPVWIPDSEVSKPNNTVAFVESYYRSSFNIII